MSNLNSLSRRAKLAGERSLELYRNANDSSLPSHDLLSSALMELGLVSEALEGAIDEIAYKTKQLAIVQTEIEAERQRYLDLLEFVPDGCFVTDAKAVVLEVNRVGAALVNAQPHALVGKSLTSLIYPEDLSLFQVKLSQVMQQYRANNGTEFSVRLRRQSDSFFPATLTVNVLRQPNGELGSIQWLVRDVTERKRAEAALAHPHYDPALDRPLVQFGKGEVIPLEPQTIWLVIDGVVKITTLSDRGEEMLVGLLGEPMVFGSSLTALQTYQAVALSDVKLAAISLSEVAQSPPLAQAVLRSLQQRLQQTESLLAINGQMRVEERLNRLLVLLKQAIGQPVEQGTRLRARLTHQDFASACCTTRVTVTRLLGKLQEQGKVAQDAKNHIVFKD
ncbi:PAS domain S-box protein [Phormidium sp. FACHB-592]|uniref:PAS domain S-box protein n=1 Tax=Stenomitos frigidus AS-A4 TaxID=2933935 RepID=A0ABV0KE99_9CYAN|nr:MULTISPECIES: PAS domain-containing protein [Cyanophyceae]MBD2034628.1 PAS domain S-box protein [Leptolyngbya sp. FACHB-321]MBD2076168.1 PAS domain S-box protein [Phormidium sp. FACHB-592]